MGKKLPPGFRFHPTDVELIKYHLKRKVLGKKFHMETIAEVDIYKFAPWDLPSKSLLQTGDLKWFFFCPREKRYVNGSRAKRATEVGYWKTTGKDRIVSYNDVAVGSIKTLIFHSGKAPKGDRTDWVMYEYKLDEKELAERGVVQDSYVLCSIFKKTGLGPKNGAQYGAPFREEDWDDDDSDNGEDEEVMNGGGVTAVPSAVVPNRAVHLVNNVASTSSFVPETEMGSTVLCPSETVTSVVNTAVDCCGAPSDWQRLPPPQDEEDDLGALLARFMEQDAEVNNFDTSVQQVAEVNQVDGFDIYDGLVDLGSLAGFSGQHNAFDKVGMDNGQYLELMDLVRPLDGSAETAGRQVQAGGNHGQPFFGWDYGYG